MSYHDEPTYYSDEEFDYNEGYTTEELEMEDDSEEDNFQRLLTACRYGRADEVSSILLYIDLGSEDIAPLILSIEHGHLHLVELFIEDGRIDITGNENEALGVAIMANRPDIAYSLINAGADSTIPAFIEYSEEMGMEEMLNLLEGVRV